MVPKKKRRRKFTADSGLGVSLREKDTELIQKETCVPDGNLHGGSELEGNDGQLSQAENSSQTKEKCLLETRLGEDRYPGIPDDFTEKAAESPGEANVSSKERACPPNKALQLLETDFPEKTAESPREANMSSQETESPPNKAVHLFETGASDACINDSDSEKAVRELLQIVNVRSEVSEKGNESELPVCTACAEGGDSSHADSSETEIFVGTSREPRSSLTSQVPHDDENFNLSKICPSQKTGQSVAGGKEIEEVIKPQNHHIPPVGHTVTILSHSCPEDIGIQRQILVSDRQRSPNRVLYSVGKNVPFRSKFGFKLYHPYITGLHFSRPNSVIRESPEFVEQQNRERENERGEEPNQSLSVWSESPSEYFPRGKPSDLGELLEVATRYVVKAWVKGIHPSISGPPTNLVIKFCVDCHKKYCYDENESNHLCSKRVGGSQKPLKLMFYVELEIYDETQETLKVVLTGDQATKVFGCQPQEFVRNEEFQKRVWDSFKHLIKGGNRQNWCWKDAANFSLEPHLKGKKMNYRVVDIRPFNSSQI